MPDDPTLDFYAANAHAYAARGADGPSSRLLSFMESLPTGARILELGSGSGRDAAAMQARGFDIDATDASPELAREAEKWLGRPIRTLRFDQLDAVQAYDAVWASASLLHAPATELTDDLRRIHSALRPGGRFVASFKAGTGDGRDGFGRYYNYPSAETLLTHYRDAAPWSSLTLETASGGGYDNLPTEWLWVSAQR